MAAPQFLRSSYSDLFGSTMLPVLEELFRNELDQHPMRREMLFKVVPHDRDIWQSTELDDMPLLVSVSEGSDYTFSRPKQGYDKTFTISKYGLGFSISEEAIDDGKFDFVADATQKLARSAKETQEISAMNVFNNGFSSELTPDGLSLFNTAHTTPSGTYTISNRPTVAVDLSYSALQDGIASFRKNFVGDSGIKKLLTPKMLLVPEELRLYALELLQSEQKPDSADNNMNSVSRDGIQVVSSPHLTDADAWFLLEEPSKTGLRIIVRKSIETKGAGPDMGFVNDSVFYKCRYREALGAIRCHGVYGSPGA